MKCPKCKGNGEYFKAVLLNGKSRQEILVKCDMCHGTGKVSQTNEEWFKQCNTEQFADKLTDFSFWLVPNLPKEDKREQIRKRIVEWLKQTHTEVIDKWWERNEDKPC